eukprot:scaffold46379_cov37-Tisochrysis_lutea.AAC.2
MGETGRPLPELLRPSPTHTHPHTAFHHPARPPPGLYAGGAATLYTAAEQGGLDLRQVVRKVDEVAGTELSARTDAVQPKIANLIMALGVNELMEPLRMPLARCAARSTSLLRQSRGFGDDVSGREATLLCGLSWAPRLRLTQPGDARRFGHFTSIQTEMNCWIQVGRALLSEACGLAQAINVVCERK